MAEVTVTRNHQVTLTKNIRDKLGIREGDRVIVNVLGESALITKKAPKAFRDAPSFLPEDFDQVLSRMRGFDRDVRVDRGRAARG